MKFLRYTLVLLFLGMLASCYEVNEEIVIKEDGSGTYLTKMDMSPLIEMLQTFAGEEELTKDGLDKAIDTTILFKDILDSSKDATAEQRALMDKGTMKMQMNIKEKLFKMDMHFPFTSYGNLQKLMEGQANGTGGMSDMFKGFLGGEKKPAPDSTRIIDEAKEPDLKDIAGIFDVVARNGLISKKKNEAKYKALLAMPDMDKLKSLQGSGMEILYTTTIRLPRPVKNADNPIIKLSEDKKTVTMRYNLLDLLENPDKYAYTITY